MTLSKPLRLFRLLWPALLLCLAGWAHAEAPRFDILEYVVEGNRSLGAEAIETAVYPHLGEGRSIADAEAARAALERAYHQAGFLTVFVNLPEQRVEGGAVRLQVVEGEVERLRVSGARYYSLGEIKARVPELAEGAVPYFPDVQKQLAGLARAADRKITPVLRAGREPGKVEVELKVADQAPLHGSLELNDRYSADTSRTRLAGSLRWDNLWQREHSLGVSYQLAPENPDDSKALSLTYAAPVTAGNYLAAYLVRTESDVATLGTLGVIGNGAILGLRYILPLRARAGLSHTLTLGVDYKDFDQTVRLQGADSYNTPIRYLPFSLGWDGNWGSETARTRLNLSAHWHLRDVVGEDGDFANKRFKGSSGYAYLRGSGEQSWRWASGMSLNLRAGFQLAEQPLISNEGLVLGGADTVRGYLESEVVGDRGLHLGLEWQSAPLGLAAGWELRALTFLEGGRVWVVDPLPSQTSLYSLAGAGMGLRLKAGTGLSGGLDLAWPLEDAGRTHAGDGRIHARLGYSF